MERNKIKSILKEYVNSNIVLTEQELNQTLLNEGWKEVLLGIALLTGVNLNKTQAQTAKNAISKEEVKNQIEQTLQDTSILNKITKNLSSDVKSKIFQNAEEALSNLESETGRVSARIKTKSEKGLESKLRQGYALADVETSYDTTKIGKDTVIFYTQPINFGLHNDELFISGSYKLSPKGIKDIQILRDSIKKVGGKIESVFIEASTDKEPIKMGNEKLTELRAQTIASYFNDVDSVKVNLKPNQGPDLFKPNMSKPERDSVRQETSKYRYVTIDIKATYQDTIVDPKESVIEVVEKNTYILIKTIENEIGTISVKKGKPKLKSKVKKTCGKTPIDCPRFGQKS